ncbi:MAG: N-acetylmuramoyl-L-alanine amidase [Candidatus Hydrogenedentota bacterium]
MRRLYFILIFSIFMYSCAPFKPSIKKTVVSDRIVKLSKEIKFNITYESKLKEKNNALSGWSFVLDPGHGGKERGALSPVENFASEADLNLAVALFLGGMLEASGAKVYYTRKADLPVSDTDNLKIELKTRASISNTIQPDFFISIHHNASSDQTINKIEVYYKLFNQGLCPTLSDYLSTELNKLYPSLQPVVLPGNFSVLRNTNNESILIENCYLSHKPTALSLEKITLLKKEAEAIYNAILDYSYNGNPFISVSIDTVPEYSITIKDHLPLKEVSFTFYKNEPVYKTTLYPDTIMCRLLLEAIDYDTAIVSALNIKDREAVNIFYHPEYKLRTDTIPFVLIISTDTSYEAVTIKDSHLIIKSIITESDLASSLKIIETIKPDYVLVVINDNKYKITHYFRSSAGLKLASFLSSVFDDYTYSAESHYLLTHTSMTAIVIHTDLPSQNLYPLLFRSIKDYLAGDYKPDIKPVLKKPPTPKHRFFD